MLQLVQLLVLFLVLPLNVGNVLPDILLPRRHFPRRGGSRVGVKVEGDDVGHSDGLAGDESLGRLFSLRAAVVPLVHAAEVVVVIGPVVLRLHLAVQAPEANVMKRSFFVTDVEAE